MIDEVRSAFAKADRQAGAEEVVIGGFIESNRSAEVPLNIVVQIKCESTVAILVQLSGLCIVFFGDRLIQFRTVRRKWVACDITRTPFDVFLTKNLSAFKNSPDCHQIISLALLLQKARHTAENADVRHGACV